MNFTFQKSSKTKYGRNTSDQNLIVSLTSAFHWRYWQFGRQSHNCHWVHLRFTIQTSKYLIKIKIRLLQNDSSRQMKIQSERTSNFTIIKTLIFWKYLFWVVNKCFWLGIKKALVAIHHHPSRRRGAQVHRSRRRRCSICRRLRQLHGQRRQPALWLWSSERVIRACFLLQWLNTQHRPSKDCTKRASVETSGDERRDCFLHLVISSYVRPFGRVVLSVGRIIIFAVLLILPNGKTLSRACTCTRTY